MRSQVSNRLSRQSLNPSVIGCRFGRIARIVVVVVRGHGGPATPSYKNSAGLGNNEERCFCLETMSEDGQGWVMDELGQKLVGLAHRTPRVNCRTTQLLSYRGDMSDGNKSMRCERLDLDLGWEATARGVEDKKFTGQAKVTMCNKDHHDVVDVAVSVDPDCLTTLPDERERVMADVVYAVESLDTAIMEKLNDFLWSMEQHNPHPASQETDASSTGERADWGRI